MSVTIKQRGDISANWTAANPILALREMGMELDTQRFKVGDGVSAWDSLGYWEGSLVDYYTKSEANALLAAKSDIAHAHNDLYYTESEANALLAAKSDSAHAHNDLYYTESEANALLATKLGSNAKAADSSKLNGASDSESATVSTIVKRNSSGHIFASYFNASMVADAPANPTWVYASSDSYIRKMTLANFKSAFFTRSLASLTADFITTSTTPQNVKSASVTVTSGAVLEVDIRASFLVYITASTLSRGYFQVVIAGTTYYLNELVARSPSSGTNYAAGFVGGKIVVSGLSGSVSIVLQAYAQSGSTVRCYAATASNQEHAHIYSKVI